MFYFLGITTQYISVCSSLRLLPFVLLSSRPVSLHLLDYHVPIILVVDARVLGCVADSLQQRRFAGISPTDYKDTKASILCSQIIGVSS